MIVKHPHPSLQKKCTNFKWSALGNLDKDLRRELDEYQKAHSLFLVVGLAAPQIGRSVPAFLAFNTVFYSPVITYLSKETIPAREGCCSLGDDEWYKVERSNEVGLRWLDKSRQLRIATFTGSQAVIIQHEMDHLNGVMINDRGTPLPKVPQEDKTGKQA